MDYPKFILSNQKEESISKQRVKTLKPGSCSYLLSTIRKYFGT